MSNLKYFVAKLLYFKNNQTINTTIKTFDKIPFILNINSDRLSEKQINITRLGLGSVEALSVFSELLHVEVYGHHQVFDGV